MYHVPWLNSPPFLHSTCISLAWSSDCRILASVNHCREEQYPLSSPVEEVPGKKRSSHIKLWGQTRKDGSGHVCFTFTDPFRATLLPSHPAPRVQSLYDCWLRHYSTRLLRGLFSQQLGRQHTFLRNSSSNSMAWFRLEW